MEAAQFAKLGADRLGYIAPVLSDDAIEFYQIEFPTLADLLTRGCRVFMLFAADGSPISIRGTCAEAMAVAKEQGLSASLLN